MKRKGGIRQRLGLDGPSDGDPPAPAGLPASSSGGPDGEVRKKGIRQKMARQDEPTPQPTPLNDSLRRQWCLGKLSSPQVQELAMNASLQGAAAIDGLAASANWGKSPQHLQESLMRFFRAARGVARIHLGPSASQGRQQGEVGSPSCAHAPPLHRGHSCSTR